MTDNNRAQAERDAFRTRLIQALQQTGYPTSPSNFARAFNLRAGADAVTVHGARKWLLGETLPTQEKLQILATWLLVTPQWLRYGVPAEHFAPAPQSEQSLPRDIAVLLSDYQKLSAVGQGLVRDFVTSLIKRSV